MKLAAAVGDNSYPGTRQRIIFEVKQNIVTTATPSHFSMLFFLKTSLNLRTSSFCLLTAGITGVHTTPILTMAMVKASFNLFIIFEI